MELLATIIFLILLGSILLYYSFREINWYLKKEEQKEKLCLHVKESIQNGGYEIISIREPNKVEKKNNPFKNGLRAVLPGFFGAGERNFYWIVHCKDFTGGKKTIWAEATQSIYMKPRYKFRPKIK